MKRLLPLVFLAILTGCYHRGTSLQMTPTLLAPELTSSLLAGSSSAIVYDQLDRLASALVVPLRPEQIEICRNKTAGGYTWLPTDPQHHLLLILDSDRRHLQKINKDGWQLDPIPVEVSELTGRSTLAQLESLLPQVTPWSRVYLLAYPDALTSLTLQYAQYKVKLDLR